MIKERAIQNEIITALRFLNIFCWTNSSVGIFDPTRKVFRKPHGNYSIKGVSDILGCIDGRFIAIEVKSEKGKLSAEQREFIAKVKDNGGVAFVAKSAEQAAAELSRLFPHHRGLQRLTRSSESTTREF